MPRMMSMTLTNSFIENIERVFSRYSYKYEYAELCNAFVNKNLRSIERIVWKLHIICLYHPKDEDAVTRYYETRAFYINNYKESEGQV